PQNPLKSAGDYAPLHERLGQAQNVAQGHPWLRVTDIETKLGTRYTIDSLTKIIIRHPSQRFIWIMGADSLAQFHHWKDWQRIGRLIPICVMSRPGDERDALSSVAARRWARHRLPRRQAKKLVSTRPPAWVYLPIVHNPESATRLRQLK
ncbi:MAG: nicotinic acid mononucleotide adenylyltransferase, partial [Pseudomonadota bacterium]